MKSGYMMMGVASVVLVATAARADLTTASGYALQVMPTPGVVQGGVVKRGNALIVGQGDFGPGGESIVRLEAGRATTIATGFGGLGGFDLAPDGTLYVVDNCYTQDFLCDAATTGDTVYAIPDALTRTTPLAAADAEMLPPGSIPFPFDVLSTPMGLLVSDAAGPDVGRVVRVESSGVVDVCNGLDFAAGLAFDDPWLYVANAAPDFTGEIHGCEDGSPLGALVDALPGAAGLALDGDGNLLLGAGSTLLEVDAAGDTTELVSGFGFAGDVAYDADTDVALVLDFGLSAVIVVCPDEDADGVCDGTCSDGVPLEEARLSFKQGRTDGAGSFRLKTRLRIDGGLVADPVEDGMGLQVLGAGGERVLDVKLPGGAGWRAKKKDRGWRFRDKTGTLAVTDVKIARDRRDDDVLKISVRSRRHTTIDLAVANVPLRVTVTLDADAECGTSAFAGCETREGSLSCE